MSNLSASRKCSSTPHFSPGAVMIAEDFGPVCTRPVYTRGQKTREGAASAVRHRHDHRHRGQTSETQELFDADKRPGEKCGLGSASKRRTPKPCFLRGSPSRRSRRCSWPSACVALHPRGAKREFRQRSEHMDDQSVELERHQFVDQGALRRDARTKLRDLVADQPLAGHFSGQHRSGPPLAEGVPAIAEEIAEAVFHDGTGVSRTHGLAKPESGLHHPNWRSSGRSSPRR